MAFTARTLHPDATLAFAGKTIHGHAPTPVSKREAEHLRGNYPGVVVEESEGPDAEDSYNDVPVRTAAEERRDFELRGRRGEFEPTFDHGYADDPESDPYRERRVIQHKHDASRAKGQAENQALTRPATKDEDVHAPRLEPLDEENEFDETESLEAQKETDESLQREREASSNV